GMRRSIGGQNELHVDFDLLRRRVGAYAFGTQPVRYAGPTGLPHRLAINDLGRRDHMVRTTATRRMVLSWTMATTQLASVCGTAFAQPAGEVPSDVKPLHTHDISLDQAHAILAAAVAKAAEIDTKMDIAIVDAGGNLKAFARMDGAWIGSIDISIKK